jgi:hypothetical protein
VINLVHIKWWFSHGQSQVSIYLDDIPSGKLT